MIIDGRKMAEEILENLAGQVKHLSSNSGLTGVLVGDSQSSQKFLELKQKAAEKIGLNFEIKKFPESVTMSELQIELPSIVKQPFNIGLIVELPLPAHLKTQEVLDLIPLEKDVDVLSTKVQRDFFSNQSMILPPAIEAVKMIFEKYQIDPKGKNCAVFGNGLLVGKPVSHWLKIQGAKVEVIDEFTKDPESFSREADIIISGVGKADLIKSKMVKDGAVVIDFGYENVGGQIRGDVDFKAVSKKAALVTPVPGGVGPLVVAAVLKNCLILASQNS